MLQKLRFADSLKLFILAVVAILFFSFKLTDVPKGLTVDEAAFGYNATLLSQTYRDQNDRFLPIFVLSLHGKDWRQPVTQYFMVGYFKLFGASVYNLRFTSVLVVSVSVVLAYLLGKEVFGNLGGVISALTFLTTPIVMIHAHLGLDNVMPIPFIILWLLFLSKYEKTKNIKFLVVSALSLGICFYTYKGARIAVPVLSILTCGYLYLLKNKWLKAVSVFCLTIFPFYAITPLLEYKYAGAVFNNQKLTTDSVYSFLYYYFSNFDLSFLFVKGDQLMYHTTGKHGVFLLTSLPFFILGIYQAFITKNKFLIFLVTSFFLSPILMGFIGSEHRASRIMYLIPLYALLVTAGFVKMAKIKKWGRLVVGTLVVLVALNYADFLAYYWYSYADATKHIFYQTDIQKTYKVFYEEGQKRKLTYYISSDLVDLGLGETDTELFLRSIYFPVLPKVLEKDQKLPEDGILLSPQNDLPLTKFEEKLPRYFIYTN